MIDSASALARIPIFAGVSRIDLVALAGELEEVELKPGEYVVREGEESDGVYVIETGEAATTVGERPNEDLDVEPSLLAPGESFGAMTLVADSPHAASVVAYTALKVWRLPADRFRMLLARESSIARYIERELAGRLVVATRDAGELRAGGRRLASVSLDTLPAAAHALVSPALWQRRRQHIWKSGRTMPARTTPRCTKPCARSSPGCRARPIAALPPPCCSTLRDGCCRSSPNRAGAQWLHLSRSSRPCRC